MTGNNGSGQQEPPKIEFPCKDYPIKVMGEAGDAYYQFAVEVLERHAPGLDASRITVKESRNGSFQSITFFITATGVEQLQALHNELKASSKTKMVL
jgi:putative lipoic acid-binding regulatory protein